MKSLFACRLLLPFHGRLLTKEDWTTVHKGCYQVFLFEDKGNDGWLWKLSRGGYYHMRCSDSVTCHEGRAFF